MWPKIGDKSVSYKLAAAGCIRDEVLPLADVAKWLLQFLVRIPSRPVLKGNSGGSGRSTGCHWQRAVSTWTRRQNFAKGFSRRPSGQVPGPGGGLMADWKREKALWCSGCALVGSCDEAGRGPLAGPVVAAITVFSSRCHQQAPGLQDSHPKGAWNSPGDSQLCHSSRHRRGPNDVIDDININATKLAMRGPGATSPETHYLLVDALEPRPAGKVRLEGNQEGQPVCICCRSQLSPKSFVTG